ncbi:hypothetical protein FEE95_12115 [Maribacter algarum]|uniref:LVIVD repeat-containing protein n=1 Tax=Maribacter algarum (ex Zhang et al. 2020) TaxID=2578118 RepID=A0A5S3PR57_9FLAO|nr:hypothetical protein [Maribacter algarum]TMM57227.1 hypothetical protein FEE95_12115 [Maribacter algarum]
MKKVSLTALAVFFFAVSCSDETTIYSDPQSDVLLESSQAVLESSIVYDNAGVIDITEEATLSGRSSKNDEDQLAGDYPLTLVAQVAAPSRSGAENLTAAHVDLVDDYAYVAYNTVEDGYSGAIDIINVSDPTNPRITSRIYYTNADINSVKYENGYVYAVGGFDSEKSATIDFNSFVGKIPVSGGRFDLSNITYGFQEGFNATDVKTTSNSILVTSGKDGFLKSYSKNDLSAINEAPFADLRSIAINGSTIAVLNAAEGVSILDSNFNTTKEISISSDFGDFSKRTIDFSGENIVVAEGSRGAGIYNMSTGNLIEYVPILINPEGVDPANVVTNAVAKNENVLLMANGGAGLCLSEDQGDNTDLVGIIELSGSTNFVASKGDYIFAASGKSGLQIIKLNRPSDSLEASCADIPVYSGQRNLNVNEGENLAYRGSKRFNSVNVSGELLLCGSWTVSNDTNINDNASFSMNGTYVVGRNNKRKDIKVNENGIFRVEGNLTIYGDLVLNDGATIEFLGSDSVVNIFGEVKKASTAEVIGTFDDVRNKF